MATKISENALAKAFPAVDAGIQPFGSDDGHPRHVNQNLVLVICLLFTKYFLGSGFYRQALRRLVGSEDLAAAMLADVRF